MPIALGPDVHKPPPMAGTPPAVVVRDPVPEFFQPISHPRTEPHFINDDTPPRRPANRGRLNRRETVLGQRISDPLDELRGVELRPDAPPVARLRDHVEPPGGREGVADGQDAILRACSAR